MIEILVFLYVFVGLVVLKENYGVTGRFWESVQAAISWPFLLAVLFLFLFLPNLDKADK